MGGALKSGESRRSLSCRRCGLVTVAALLSAPVFLSLAWVQRLRLIQVVGRVGGGVDIGLKELNVDWRYEKRSESITLSVENFVVYSPRDPKPIVSIERIAIRLHRPLNHTAFRFKAAALFEGLDFQFIAYDLLLADTNVKRLVRALGGDEAAAEGTLADAPEIAESSVADAAAPSTVTFTKVDLRNVSIHPAVRTGSAQILLPAVTLLDEELSMRMLSHGISIGLLNWLSSLVVRTLASTSIDTVGTTLDGSVELLASTIGRALDLVEFTNRHTHLPGSSALGGATSAVRRVVRGVRAAVSAVVGGVAGGAKEMVGVQPTPVEILRGIERAVDALQGGLVDGAASLLDGVDKGVHSLVDGVETSANNRATRGLLPGISPLFDSAVGAAAGVAKGSVHAATACTTSVAAGVLEGSAAAIGGAAGGMSEVFGGMAEATSRVWDGLVHGGGSAIRGFTDGVGAAVDAAARGDAAGVIDGGGRLLDGLVDGGGVALQGFASGGGRLVGGTVDGTVHFGRSVARGVKAVAAGVLEPTEKVARDMASLFPHTPRECVAHSVFQRTLLSRLGLRRRKGQRREARVCPQ